MCASDCGRCIDCIETDDYAPTWRNPRFQAAHVEALTAERDIAMKAAATERLEADMLRRNRGKYQERSAEVASLRADLARVTEDRDEWTRDAIEWRNRYEALRADVAEYVGSMGFVSAFTKVQLLAVRNRLKRILAADANRVAERAES